MRTPKTAGFTIIEVILVLAVTGLMMVGILAGSAAQVHQQEYRDSVRSLESELQTQYTTVQNPMVDRTKAASTETCGITQATSRGASPNCFIVGRLVTSDGGGTLTESPILGVAPNGDSSVDINNKSGVGGEAATANGWHLYIDNQAVDSYTVNWGSQLRAVNGAKNVSDKFSILLIMSPADGSIRTYTALNQVVKAPSSLYGLLTHQDVLNLCVVGGSGSIGGDPLAVQIASNTSSAAGVTMLSQSEGVCHDV